MSSREFTNWLQSHRLGACVDVFAEHDVTWDDLGELGDEDLRKMGLKTRERRRLLRAIASDHLVGGGERKQLTVLYYDLVQSVTLSNLIGDPEAFLEIERSIHAKFEALLSRLGGTKYQMEGDGAWYLFGWPAIEGNPAARAAHAAFAIMQAARELELPVPAGWVLQFRVTIASDLMVIMPTKREGEVEVAGNAINLAARLKRVCRPGSIVLDRATRDRLGRAFHVAALEPQSFEGIEGKVEAFVVGVPRSGLTTFAARDAARSGPLAGRYAEMAGLRKQWLLACEGHGQVGFLVGTAGIGKSRLALALSDLAAEQGGTVIGYQCSDLYRSSALYPLLDRLRRDARIRHVDLPEKQIAKLRKLLRDRVDDPAVDDDLCRYLLDIELSSTENRKRDDLRENAFQLMIEQLKRMTASRPYLLVIEDVQWIDPTSRELLDAVIGLAPELSLLVLVTSRPSPAGESMITALDDKANVATYRLGPLSDEHSLAIIANAFEGIHCPPSVTEAILKRTEPDRLPFYLEELAHFVRNKLMAQGDQWSEADASQAISASMPVNLEMFLRESLDRLSPSTKALAQIASAVGPKFSHELLGSVCRFEPEDFEPAFVELVESRFIYVSSDAQPVQYGFRHELLRDAAYQSMLRRTRKQLHQHIANTLCTSHPEIAGQMPEFVAHHWTEAGDAERAIEYWSVAGERATVRSAVKEAFGHFHRAIELLDQIKDRPAAADTELMLRVRASGVEAAIEGYSAQESQRNYARILELSTVLDRANERFMAHLGLAASLYVHGKLYEALEHGRACLDMAVQTQSADHLLHGHRILSEISFYVGAFAECYEHANESIARYRMEDHHRLIAGGLGDDPKVLCLMYRALSHWILGRADLSIVDCEQALSLSTALGHVYSSAQAEFYASWLYALMRDTRRAELFASRAIASCEEGGFDFYAGLARVIHGWAISFGPDPASAIAEVSRGIEQVRAPEADVCLSCFLPWLAEVHLRVGNVDKGLVTMREAHELAQETFYAAERLRVEADLRAAVDLAGAADCYLRALETARQQGSIAFELRTTLSMCKNELCGIQDLEPLLERMVATSEDHDLREARKMLGSPSDRLGAGLVA
jgi:class 3 adenylate cyclase/tetratricopeptide (TPR) repeat protein